MESRSIYDKIYVIGSGHLAFACADICKEYITDVSVFELKVTESTVLEKLCDKNGIPYQSVSARELTAFLINEKDKVLIVSAASTYLVPEEIIAKEEFTIINWHNALLPKHKGRNAEVWAIYEGDAQSGVTWHYITGEIDGGDIICQEGVEITDKTTAMSLYRQQVEMGEAMFRRFADALLVGTCGRKKQPFSVEESMHFSKQRPNGGYLDLDWDVDRISRFLRSMDYGSLLLLGKMKVSYSGKAYEFYRYKIKETDGFIPEKEIIFEDGVLTLNHENTSIIIKGLQETE